MSLFIEEVSITSRKFRGVFVLYFLGGKKDKKKIKKRKRRKEKKTTNKEEKMRIISV